MTCVARPEEEHGFAQPELANAHAVLCCPQNATLTVPNVAVRFDYQVTSTGQRVSLFYSDRAATTATNGGTITTNLKQNYGVSPLSARTRHLLSCLHPVSCKGGLQRKQQMGHGHAKIDSRKPGVFP